MDVYGDPIRVAIEGSQTGISSNSCFTCICDYLFIGCALLEESSLFNTSRSFLALRNAVTPGDHSSVLLSRARKNLSACRRGRSRCPGAMAVCCLDTQSGTGASVQFYDRAILDMQRKIGFSDSLEHMGQPAEYNMPRFPSHYRCISFEIVFRVMLRPNP